MKKVLVYVLTCVLLMSALMGCGQSSKETESGTASNNVQPESKTEEVQQKKPVELLFSIWDKNQIEGMEKIAAAFKEKHPHVTIKVELTPWSEYWTKLEAGAVGNVMPDIFWMHTNEIYKYAKSGKLMPIQEGMIDTTKFDKGLMSLFTYEGQLMGVPKDFDTIAVFYNKEIFDANGEAYPDETWDWEKYLEVAKRLTDKDAGIYGAGAPMYTQNGVYPFVFQNGGEIITADGKSGYALPETQEAVKFYFDMILEHGVSPTLEYFAENGKNETFTSGKLAMYITGSWKMKSFSSNEYIGDKMDVAVLPKGKKRASISNGLTYAGAATTNHPEEVKAFLSFAGSEEANIIQGKSGAAIPAYEGTQSHWVELFTGYNVQAFIDMLDYSVPFPTSPSKPKWGDVEKSTLTAYGAGELTAEEAFSFLAEEMDKILAKE